jgi:hypothetical protein
MSIFAGEAGELAGAGVGENDDTELQRAAFHGADVLQNEGAVAAVERVADAPWSKRLITSRGYGLSRALQ